MAVTASDKRRQFFEERGCGNVKEINRKIIEKKLHNMGTEELIQIIMSLYRSNKLVEQSINL